MIRPLKNLTAAALMRLATVTILAVAALSCGAETSAYVKRIMSFYDNAVREISL